MARNVLLLKAGQAAPEVRRTVGDYDRMFIETLAAESSDRLHVHQTHLGQALPARAKDYDAIWMTGSPKSVRELEPWMKLAADFMREAAEQGVPVLGVCFGHQLLSWSFGARVVKNTLGREIGSISVTLSPAGQRDPLFEEIDPAPTFQATHEDIVEALPASATILASNANTPVQALAYGPRIRTVQFHPEMAPAAMRAMIEARAASLDADAVARGERSGTRVPTLLAGLRATGHGRRLLLNFLRHFA